MQLSRSYILWVSNIATLSGAAYANPVITGEQATFKLSSPTRSIILTDPQPMCISLEFFTFADYMTTVPSTSECINNLAQAIGQQIPVRIGGTTADYGTYDPQALKAVNYTLTPHDKGVPKHLTFGPEYIRLASTIPGPVTIGLNRRLNDLPNTLLAAKEAVKQMKNLYAIELGNEPEYWKSKDPIAEGRAWNFEADLASEIKWTKEVSTGLGVKNIIQAGNFLGGFKIANLAHGIKQDADYIKSFGLHSYPQNTCGHSKTNLTSLMNHKSIVDYLKHFIPDIQAAAALNKPTLFSETNSVACGGTSVSPTFGAALWTMDYIMQSLLIGIKRLCFHHGTLGNSQYSFWGRYTVASPYYGAYFAAMALKNIDGISMLDDGTSPYAGYLLTQQSRPVRILLYNSRYRPAAKGSDSPTTSKVNFSIDLTGMKLNQNLFPVLRLQDKSSESRADRRHETPNITGIAFEQKTCKMTTGGMTSEFASVTDGKLVIDVQDSEAVLIQLDNVKV